jgi:hypothetical protein
MWIKTTKTPPKKKIYLFTLVAGFTAAANARSPNDSNFIVLASIF